MANVDFIRDTLHDVWPKVLAGIEEQIARANGRQLSNTRRRVVEQTLWELGRAGLLVTPEKKAVLDAAIAWDVVQNDADDALYDQADKRLSTAVESLQS